MVSWLSLVVCVSVILALADATAKPNILFILTDDQDLKLNSLDYMPLLRKNLLDEGTFFENYFVSTPLCCPSRASMLRGQYAHNTQIVDLSPPGGGVLEFRKRGLENSTIGTWLHSVGYQTAFFGKYMNAFDCADLAREVPPGWDDWFALCDPYVYAYYNSRYSNNGKIEAHEGEYQTDTLRNKTLNFLRTRDAKKPFFIHLSGVAPHQPATPAVRHQNLFSDLKAPRKPSFNEPNVAKEPAWVKHLPLLDQNQTDSIDELFRNRLRALQAVDENVEAIVNELRTLNILDNTYIFYTADNGFHLGEHRLTQGKREPYEEDIHVPFIVRGPNVGKNVTLSAAVQNVDLAPTFAELSGATIPAYVDGKSLVPLLTPTVPSLEVQADFRAMAFTENYATTCPLIVAANGPAFMNNTWQLIRIVNSQGDTMFSSWCTDDYQNYNVRADPFQLNNTFKEEPDTYTQQMYSNLVAMASCSGASCHNPQVKNINQLKPIRPCFRNV